MTTEISRRSRTARRAARFAAAGAVVAGVVAVPAVAASASTYPIVKGVTVTNDGGSSVSGTSGGTSGTSGATSGTSTLPFTGGDVAGLALIGAGAVGVGYVLVRRSRRRRVVV